MRSILHLLVYLLSHLFDLYSFLEGPKAALVASKDFYDGHYTEKAEQGIRAFARVYSAWAYGQTVRCFISSSSAAQNLRLCWTFDSGSENTNTLSVACKSHVFFSPTDLCIQRRFVLVQFKGTPISPLSSASDGRTDSYKTGTPMTWSHSCTHGKEATFLRSRTEEICMHPWAGSGQKDWSCLVKQIYIFLYVSLFFWGVCLLIFFFLIFFFL